MFIRSFESAVLSILCIIGTSCATSATKFSPDELKDNQGAFFGRVHIFNYGKEISGSCYVEFKDEKGERKAYLKLDNTGWIFASVTPGDTFLSKLDCTTGAQFGPINVTFDDLKFPVPSKNQITYFGDMAFRFIRVPGTVIPFRQGRYDPLPAGERRITVTNNYVDASREYRDRYANQHLELRVVDATTPWPFTVDCQKFHKAVHFALNNHYSVVQITPEIRDRTVQSFLNFSDPDHKFLSANDRARLEIAITEQLRDESGCTAMGDIRNFYVEKLKANAIHLPMIEAADNAPQEPFNALVLKAFLKSLDSHSDLIIDASKGTLGSGGDVATPTSTSAPELLEFKLKRSGNELSIGVIKIQTFTSGTSEKIQELLTKAEADSLSGLVLDLSSSPGGLLDEVKGTIGLFVSDAPIYTVMARGGKAKLVSSDPTEHIYERPLAVLVGRNTGAGAETVAGALKDLNRALLVGNSTNGNGGVVTQVLLGSGRMIALTVGMTFFPSGRSVQHIGLQPDVRTNLMTKDPVSRKRESELEGALPNPEPVAPFVPSEMQKVVFSDQEIAMLQRKSDLRQKSSTSLTPQSEAAEILADWVAKTE
jgi:Peptidase family S41